MSVIRNIPFVEETADESDANVDSNHPRDWTPVPVASLSSAVSIAAVYILDFIVEKNKM